MRVPVIALLLVLAVPTVGGAQLGPEAAAAIEARLTSGVLSVLADDGHAFAVLGRVSRESGAGDVVSLASGARIFAGTPLAPDHPVFLDAVAGRPARVVGTRGTCDGHLGAPVVTVVEDAQSYEWRHNQPAGRHPRPAVIARVFREGPATALLLAEVVGCADGLVAITDLTRTPRVLEPARADRARQRALDAAFATTPARQASLRELRTLPADWPRPERRRDRFRVSETREIALVMDLLDGGGCGDFVPFPVLFDTDGATTRALTTRHAWVKLAVDLRGDGVPFLVFASANSGAVTFTLARVPPEGDALEEIFAFTVGTSIGC